DSSGSAASCPPAAAAAAGASPSARPAAVPTIGIDTRTPRNPRRLTTCLLALHLPPTRGYERPSVKKRGLTPFLQMRPSRTARATAWERLFACSFVVTSCITALIVRSL